MGINTSKKQILIATVVDNISISSHFYRLKLNFQGDSCKAISGIYPGQFVEIDISNLSLPPRQDIPENLADSAARQIILRRPFSFCDVKINGPADLTADILYCVLGPGTLRMTTLSNGDKISLIGPLGVGFSVPDDKTQAVLIAGGMGVAPLLHLAGYLNDKYSEINIKAFIGAKSVNDFPMTFNGKQLQDFSQLGIETHIATDDGSCGFSGFVTDCAAEWLKNSHPAGAETIIYSCGPEPMLGSVANHAAEHNIYCQMSLERMMACGIGLCQSCAVAVNTAEVKYKLCCKDGPVFDSKEVVFEQ